MTARQAGCEDVAERGTSWRDRIAAVTGIMSSADWAQTVVILIFLILILMAVGAWAALIISLGAG